LIWATIYALSLGEVASTAARFHLIDEPGMMSPVVEAHDDAALIRVRGGRMRATTADDLTVMASAAAAIAHLTPVYREHTATMVVGQVATTATACVRSPRATHRRANPTSAVAARQPDSRHPPRRTGPDSVLPVPTSPALPIPPHRSRGSSPARRGTAAPTGDNSARAGRERVLWLARHRLADRPSPRCAITPRPTTTPLLIVALLEHGGPMTLTQVAARFEVAGIASAEDALRALQRCQPARPPIYRDGDQYALDLAAQAATTPLAVGARAPPAGCVIFRGSVVVAGGRGVIARRCVIGRFLTEAAGQHAQQPEREPALGRIGLLGPKRARSHASAASRSGSPARERG
jgi:hypothetical protein